MLSWDDDTDRPMTWPRLLAGVAITWAVTAGLLALTILLLDAAR